MLSLGETVVPGKDTSILNSQARKYTYDNIIEPEQVVFVYLEIYVYLYTNMYVTTIHEKKRPCILKRTRRSI